MTAPRPLVAFDLDGTLVDSAPDLLDTLDVVMTGAGFRTVDREAAREMIGAGARMLIRRALEAEQKILPESELDELNRRFLDHYAAHIADSTRPFPGVLEALDRLADQGFVLAVCTNKLERLARLLLDALDLTGRFAAITGGDTYGKPKPDALPLLSTVAAVGATPAATLMVGDSITDIRTAKAAAVPSIAVTFGYTDIPPRELGADAVIDHFAELNAAVDRLLARALA